MKQSEWKNGKHQDQWITTLTTYAFPIIGSMPVADIKARHVVQCLKPIWLIKKETAKHGMFSYFLMKGMEGDADANQDNQITAVELHAYVQHNVIQQSSGNQTPELQGDADRVLVRFQ